MQLVLGEGARVVHSNAHSNLGVNWLFHKVSIFVFDLVALIVELRLHDSLAVLVKHVHFRNLCYANGIRMKTGSCQNDLRKLYGLRDVSVYEILCSF